MVARLQRSSRLRIGAVAAGALALLCLSRPARADTKSGGSKAQQKGKVVDPQEVVDPDEVVTDDNSTTPSGPPSSLCIIQQSPDTSKLLFVTFASHDMWRPCRGRDRFAMTYADFYKAVGRPDLLASQDRRYTTETVLFWSQFTLELGAFACAAIAIFGKNKYYWWGAGGAAVGALTIGIIRGAQAPLPIDSKEAARLADKYNSGGTQAPDQKQQGFLLDPPGAHPQLVVPIVAGFF